MVAAPGFDAVRGLPPAANKDAQLLAFLKISNPPGSYAPRLKIQ